MNQRSSNRRLIKADALLWFGDKTVRSRVKDISHTGVYFYGDFPVSATFKFAIRLPVWAGVQEGTLLRAEGRFVRYDLLDSRRVGFAATIERSETVVPKTATSAHPLPVDASQGSSSSESDSASSGPGVPAPAGAELEDYIGWSIRVTGAGFNGSTMVRLLAISDGKILVSDESEDESIWVALSDVRIG